MVSLSALSPSVCRVVEDWADRAAVGHLLSWRLNDYQPVERSAEDMVFSGGKDATIWICDRLARTYLGEWKASSLHWELAYRHAPTEVAIWAGVNPAILAERTVTEGMVTQELRKRLTRPGLRDDVANVAAEDLVPSVALLLQQGNPIAARQQAQNAYQAYPADPVLAMAYAFCLIPLDRREACRILAHLKPDRPEARALVTANLAVCDLFDGRLADAVTRASTIDVIGLVDTVWLWDPQSAVQGVAELRLECFAEWLPRLLAVAQST